MTLTPATSVTGHVSSVAGFVNALIAYARRTPSAPAVVTRAVTATYGDLVAEADRIQRLLSPHLDPQVPHPVAVLAGRTPSTVAAVRPSSRPA